MRIWSLVVCLGLIGLQTAIAAPSRITATDGTVMIGEILKLEGGVYEVQTSFGVVRVPATSVRSIESGAPAQQQAGPISGGLRAVGSNTIGAQLVPSLLEAYAGARGLGQIEWTQGATPEDRTLSAKGSSGAIEVYVGAHGSGTSFTALAEGRADIGMSSRRVNAAEIGKVQSAGFGDLASPTQEHVLALDGLLVMVHPSNPIASLKIEQIAAVFAGEITSWSQLGWNDSAIGPINIYSRDAKSGTFDTFQALVLKNKKLPARAKLFESSSDLSDSVANDPAGIGFAGFAYLRNAKALAIALDCGMSYNPTEFNVRTEEYPLARRLYLYTPRNIAQRAEDFLEFSLAEAAQPVTTQAGFINLTPETAPAGYASQRIAAAAVVGSKRAEGVLEYARAASTVSRLSVTFRFRSGTADLDSRGGRDIGRLAEFLRKRPADGRKVAIVGFTDDKGSYEANRRLARNRAQSVADALAKQGIAPDGVGAFGEVAPVACNSSPEGMEKNRRVEVWLY